MCPTLKNYLQFSYQKTYLFITFQIKLLESEKNDLKLKLKELESASASDGSLAPAQQTAETKGKSKKFIASDT